MEPTQLKETRALRRADASKRPTLPPHHPPITPVLQEETVMSPSSQSGTMVAGRKQQVAGAGEGEEAGLEGWGAVLKKLSVLFSMDTMFWPLGLHHNNTCGFKFLPPPF